MPSLTPFLVSNGTGAAVIIAPGGGYRDLAWGKEGLDVAGMSAASPIPFVCATALRTLARSVLRYNSIGVSAFVLKYRVPARPALPGLPKWWAPLQDAQRAIGLVRASAKQYGL